ncbi:G2/mitotic-specific cyclin-B3 isoform X2 [Heterocephalus glaber]|uniref:G2/mitotic-specific cyclin-B3 isoform X2 n=1 Tax=Heterocephalus glaber TaxID=10181 RepID=A0AAX6S896_HETGA|nr:G2/mitotic-specific cyclin-B3 isoform X2 [Heterocephalus glaber]
MPLPPQSFKPETKKFQSSKIVPSDHSQSKKMGENYQAKISPSSPQRTFKKRSAFEDLTNAFQTQPVQSKKEINKEFGKDVPKTISKSKHALELARYTEMNKKRYKLELTSAVASTASVPKILEKSLLLDVTTNSQTPTIEEVSFVTKPLILKEEPSTEVTTLIKKSLKKCTNPGEAFLLEKSLSLQEETDSDDDFVIKPVTFGKKHKSNEAAITKKTLSLKKMSTYQRKQSCLEELVILQDSNVEEGSFSVELMNLKKKPKTEKLSSPKKPLSLSSKCTTMEKISNTIKPVLLEKITSEKKLITKEPSAFMRNPTADKESLSCKPSAFKEKHTTKQEISNWKKSLTLQEKTDFKDKSLVKELSTFKQKPTTEEATLTASPVFGRTECTVQRKICTTHEKKYTIYGMQSHLKNPLEVQEVISGEESLSTKPLSFKRNRITEFYQEPSALQEKHTTQAEIGLLKKPRTLQENINSEASCVKEVVSCKKQHSTMEASHTKKPLPLKKKQKIQRKLSRYKPLKVERVTYGENSLTKDPFSFEKFTSDEDSLSQEPFVSQEKDSTQEEVSTLKKRVALQKSPTETESLFQESLAFQKQCNTEKATPSKKPLPLKKQQHTTQGTVSHLKKPLVLQTVTSEEKSPIKEPLSFKEVNMSLKKKKCTTEATPQWIDLSDWQDIIVKEKNSFFMKQVSSTKKGTTEKVVLTKTPSYLKKKQTTQRKTTSEEESLCKKLLPFKKKPTTEEKFLAQERSASKEKHTTFQEVSLSRKQIAFQEKTTTEEESYSKEAVTLKEKLITEEFLFQEPFSLHVKPTNKDESLFQKAVILQEKTNTKKESLALHEKSTMTEESLFNRLSVLKKEPSAKGAASIDRQLPIKNELTAHEQAFLLKEQLALHEKITNDEMYLIKEPLALQEYVGSEKGLFKEPLTMQEKLSTQKETAFKEHTTDIEAHFNELLAMQEKPSIEIGPVFQEPVNLQEKPTIEEEGFFIEPLALQEKAGLESEAMLKEPLALQEKPSTEMETALKEPLSLQEKPSTEKEAILKEPLAFQKKSNMEDEVLSKEPLALQEKSTINVPFFFQNMLAMNEKPTIENELSFQEPLALEENFANKEDIFPETFLILENSPRVSSNAVESSTDKFNAANMSSVGKSGANESGSKIPFSPQSRTQKEINTLEAIGKDHHDPSFSSVYAKEIFSYLKDREEKFILKKYMKRQTEITSDMRAILVDWLVEVQMSFNMSHETLYLAVKLVDHYLMKELCRKDKLQLLGSTAFLIAAKFEELFPPCVDDFLYVCEDMYQRHEMIAMEMSILKTLKFDINIPVAYHYLRRYALCLNVSMKTLTLSRFICEMTLQKYDYVHERASKLAAASFLLALYMKKLKNYAPLLEFYSGYTTFELHPLVRQLNILLTYHYCDRLKTVYTKYSHEKFFEVTKTPPLDIATLDEIFMY